jgi:ketosteroid isomerase-like protein
MARKPVELAKAWFAAAEDGDAERMADLLSDDALFYATKLRGQRFRGREAIERYLSDIGFEATGYSYTAIDDEYAVVTLSLRRRLETGGLADSTLAMVFKAEGDEIVCIDAFPSAEAAFASIAK